jgi:allantoinase
LVPSGVDEFPHVERPQLLEAMPVLAELGAVLLVHAEVPGPIEAAERAALSIQSDPRKYSTYLATRPPAAEREAIELCVELCRQTGARVHIVHFACGDAVDVLRAAKQEGLPFSAETCPHYLYFEAERIPDGNTAYKCAPPIREARHRAALRAALGDGSIDFLVSDHSPCVPELKRLQSGDFLQAWGGIASLQLGLSIAHTLCQKDGLSFAKIAEWMSAAPARMAGLSDRKGAILPGLDADFAVFDAEQQWVVRGAELAQRHPITPYEGHTLVGRVKKTFLRGAQIYDAGQFSERPQGLLQAARAKP